ncbi:hypothetical protein Tco_0170154 [Tanacetum coccineum]
MASVAKKKRKQTKRVTTSRKKESLRSNNVCNLYISREFEATQAVEAMQAVKDKETWPQSLRSGSSVKRDAQSASRLAPEMFDSVKAELSKLVRLKKLKVQHVMFAETEFNCSRLCASIFLNLDAEKQSDFIIKAMKLEKELTNKRRKIG